MDGSLLVSSRITSVARLLAASCLLLGLFPIFASGGVLELTVLDAQSGKPLPARVTLTGPRGRHPKAGVSRYQDHFLTYGFREKLNLAAGVYQYIISSGPEYYEQSGTFTMARDATDNQTVELKRFVDMKEHGWWAGDPWFTRKVDPHGIQALAEDLHLLGITNPEQVTKLADLNKDEKDGLGGPIMAGVTPESATFGVRTFGVHGEEQHVQLTNISDWMLPVHIAKRTGDSVIIHQPPVQSKSTREKLRARNETRFPDAIGEGRHHEFIYHQLLNAGIRIAPVAASGSGTNKLPPGTWRTYVHTDGDPDVEVDAKSWWNGLKSGAVIITNGPLLLPKVNRQLPGHTFETTESAPLELESTLTLHTREKVDYLQFIKNGSSVAEIRLDKWAKEGKTQLPKITFRESGWLQIRTVTRTDGAYKYAATAPWFVNVDETPRISRKAAKYFLDWVYDLARRIKKENTKSPGYHPPEVIRDLRKARDFWKARVESANAE